MDVQGFVSKNRWLEKADRTPIAKMGKRFRYYNTVTWQPSQIKPEIPHSFVTLPPAKPGYISPAYGFTHAFRVFRGVRGEKPSKTTLARPLELR
jgi:hypothetical protein